MIVVDCVQGSESWFQARLGIPTASEFATVLAKGRSGGDSKGRRTYMLKLIGERITGEPAESYTNANMERGKIMEEEARNAYAFMSDSVLVPVGFIRNGDKGCSPDSLVGGDGLLEIKTKLPHLQIDVLLRDEMPPEHMAQVQGQIWTAEREWCEFVSYWPKLPLFVKRIYRDEAYIKILSDAIDSFLFELIELETKIKAL